MTATLATLYAGDDWQIQVSITDVDGEPVELAGGSARYALARAPDMSVLVTKDSTTPGDELYLLVDGVVEVNVTAAETAALAEGTYYHEVQVVTADGETLTGLAEYLLVRGTVLGSGE